MSYPASLRQQAKWIREALDPATDATQRITLDDVDIEELEAAADYIDGLEERLLAPAQQTWQPIETAPKDGQEADLWCLNISDGNTTRFPAMFMGEDDRKWQDWHSYLLESKWRPIFWMRPIEGPTFPSTARATPCEHAAIIGLDGMWHCQRCGNAIDMATAHAPAERRSPPEGK